MKLFNSASRTPVSNALPADAETPVRAVHTNEAGLYALGEKLARSNACNVAGFGWFDFHRRAAQNAALTSEVYSIVNEAQTSGETVTPAAQWLLDNFYLVEESASEVRRDLPRRFYRELPTIEVANALGQELLPKPQAMPRTLAIAWTFVAHTDSVASPKLLKAIVDGYQSVQPLQIGELWALPSLVRFVLLENLRRLAQRVRRARDMRRIANAVADQVLVAQDGAARETILADYTPHARDATFATQLLYRLRDGSQNAGRALDWLEQQLESSGSDAEKIILVEHQTLSGGNVTTGNIIRSLRQLNDIDWTLWFEEVSKVDAFLREHTDFGRLDFHSRDQYRTAIEDLARYSQRNEFEVARRAVELSRGSEGNPAVDIGFLLIGDRRDVLERDIGFRPPFGLRCYRLYRRTGWFGIAAPVTLLTVLFLAIAAFGLAHAGLPAPAIALLCLLFALPASEAALGVFNTIVLLLLKPDRLVGYDYRDGVPDEARTLVVVPTLIGSRSDVEDSVRNLEIHHLANMRGEIYYALLSDWPDSSAEQTPADLEILDYARAMIRELNTRYPGGVAARFHLLHRHRLFNDTQQRWMGWERKRGKLHELNLLLRGDADTTFLPPETPLPEKVVNVMTLDADTRMTRDAVNRLAGKLAHPLNTPRIDAKSRLVRHGYGILQPRITASLTTGDEASFFQRVFSANRGLDPYVFAVSDVYQDLFGEGTFTGKGLYDIDAFEAALAGRIEENTVLSHDLLEGSFARAALVTDVELVEDYPTQYSVDASRHHRWARGDWQLLSFIFGPGSAVPAVSRWKMIDNLRRSLVPIFWVAASVAAWALLPFGPAAVWQALLILSLFVAPTFDIIASLLPRTREITLRGHINAVGRDIAFGTAQVALKTVLIAHNAWMMGDAIARTLYRVFVSRKHLLEWRTASQAERDGTGHIHSLYRTMYGAVIVAAIGLAIAAIGGGTGLWLALIFSLLWAASPAFAWLISRSAETEDKLEVRDGDRRALRDVARRTWLYFQTFVTAEHNHLPPDNFQETPHPVVAPRTSPTNIGVYLLSVVSARDFGWISLGNAIERMENTLTTIEKMESYRGHLYNWYDTRTLNPLLPLYVSAVDSGNLAGHLVAISAACSEWSQAPAAHLEGDFDGILDVVTILDETLADVPDDRRQLRPLRQRLKDRIVGMKRAIDVIKREPDTASIRTINLAVLATEIRKLATSIDHETRSAATAALKQWAEELSATCEAHVSDAHTDEATVDALRARLTELAVRARTFAFKMDFSFLLSEERKLLSIGYRVGEHQLDESCYDLLASEARLASLFAIAKGDIPTEHWFRLGRPIVEIGFRGALMSWSGSMFEYLMPPLVMKEPQGGILNQTNNLIIRKQMSYARSKGIPWGISEAAYNARDREMTYQYSNFGVPGLGLKRGLAQNTVIAPYATVLACQYAPREAVTNLIRLKEVGALGRYGYYDAVDFTPQRVPEGARCAVVHNYMAHHQGMSIVAAANVVFEGRMRDRFHSDPVIEAAELLLQEKAPRDIPIATIRTEAAERAISEIVPETEDSRLILDPLEALPATTLMSNGRYNVMMTATGTGYSRFGDLAVTRWRPDPTEDMLGSFIFLRDVESGQWWSATASPRRAPGERVLTIFADDKATFFKTVGTLRSELECIVGGEGDGEGRRITLHNEGSTDRFIEVTSFGEIVLAPESADNAHPAFSKMFVETEIARQNSVIFATRRKRSPGEPDIAMAHFVVDASAGSRATEAETDRRAFIGRGRSLADAAAFDPGARMAGLDGFVLDPIFALRRQVRVPANKKVSLTFWTIAAANREELDQAIALLDHGDGFQRQSVLAWTRSQVQTRHMGISLADAANIQKLARHLLYPDHSLRAPAETIAAGMASQSALWPLSISGDFPIFALRIDDQADVPIVAQALRAQEYFRAHGMLADLVIVNEQAASYVQDLQNAIDALCDNSRMRGHEHGPRQHIFTVRRDLMDDRTYRALIATARVVLHARNGTVFDQIARADQIAVQSDGDAVQKQPERALPAPATAAPADGEASGEGLEGWNGFGGFAEGGREYVVRLTGGRSTPQPWINVISNGSFGFHVSAEGAPFTWSRNSRDFQVTPWSNDPVVNRPGEAFYIHDTANGAVFSPTACVARRPEAVYEARHGQGYSVFSSEHDGIALELTQTVDPADPVKLSRLTIRNRRGAAARLKVYAYAEWMLGNDRGRSVPNIVSTHEADLGMLTAQNAYSLDFGDRVAFLACDDAASSVTADRGEFIGRAGTVLQPRAVLAGQALAGTIEAGRDPCAAILREIEVAPGAEMSMLWLLGDAGSRDEARDLAARHRSTDFDGLLAKVRGEWDGFLDAVQVETPEHTLDALVNRWLPYQALSCRIRARSAFYQASGAYGFRDQLQDTLSLLAHDPGLAREQILNAASRQFPEGDVQHWWLPRTGAGVRTMISDDVAWLAYGTAYYVATTADAGILDEELPFIEGRPLNEGEHDAFYTPEVSKTKASLYEHCARALDLAMARTGENGLPLILTGDWNDGMNRVGEHGKGQSVWLGWFLIKALRDFAPLARKRGDEARAKAWEAHADRVAQAAEEFAWDGAWYLRGTFDDGSPLGSHSTPDACMIDSIAQSWAVLSGAGDAARAGQAMDSVLSHLVDDEARIVKLFTPPFVSDHGRDPGYIKSYPPGVRENGGQYTHAATWVVMALARLGRGDDAWRCFELLNPAMHARDAGEAETYRVEPYVVAADVYSEADRRGRGGWTWYTGSAGWLYRAAVEGILGLRREGDALVVEPALPSSWQGYAATLRLGEASCRVTVRRGGEPGVSVGGARVGGPATPVPLIAGEMDIEVTLPQA